MAKAITSIPLAFIATLAVAPMATAETSKPLVVGEILPGAYKVAADLNRLSGDVGTESASLLGSPRLEMDILRREGPTGVKYPAAVILHDYRPKHEDQPGEEDTINLVTEQGDRRNEITIDALTGRVLQIDLGSTREAMVDFRDFWNDVEKAYR
ncbi:hypothetical protein CMO93_04025 [Candidatus Woesearchaeota archaeon]|nr:hypothetical protein [Candidatus Woesearchaeota archaeon]|tara:strand:+ start:4387 stop:4848 length:462 start_codon:yes stop_codon:yes gene_type:complete